MIFNLQKRWRLMICACVVLLTGIDGASGATLFFTEDFQDSNLIARGWMGNAEIVISSQGVEPGSSCAEYKFLASSRTPRINSGNSATLRRAIPQSQSIYVSYHVKYSANWPISQPRQRQRELYVLTNLEAGEYPGLLETWLIVKSLLLEGRPNITISDSRNIDLNNIHNDLSKITELRAVAGCNGSSDVYGLGECLWFGGSDYNNRKDWPVPYTYQTTGTNPLNAWHHVQWYLKLNSTAKDEYGKIKCRQDGEIQFWLDGQELLHKTDVVFRTGQHPDMAFKQFIISPYITDVGATVDHQTFWIDNLQVADAPLSGEGLLSTPTGFKIE